jgi:hypothetical protein
MLSRVAAHLILGPREEPFLAALLSSLSSACGMLIVNDNAPDPSPHAQVLQESAFAREGRLVLDRTPFNGFAQARNICLQLHRARDAGEWVAFVDADEVHGSAFARIAANLSRVPSRYDFVDGYTWHFFQSFDWYRSIERRMSFFRFSSEVRWDGDVHEQLRGLGGERVALPYVYAHYGWVLPIARQAAKERLYASLGRTGEMLPPSEWASPELERSFRAQWPSLLRFHGSHPAAAMPAIAILREQLREQFATVDAIVPRYQPPAQRVRNAMMALNYAQRWRGRALNPLARRLLSG